MRFIIYKSYALQRLKWKLIASNGVELCRSSNSFATVTAARRATWRLNAKFIFAGRPIPVEVIDYVGY